MTKRQILLVEDEDSIRDMVTFNLKLEGFEMITAADVAQAKEVLQHHTPQLILLDWMLPGVTGIQYAKQLKTDEKTREIPIIMLTAKAEEDNKIRGLEVGADDYITKPFSPRELAARIKSVLRRGPLLNDEGVIAIDKLRIDPNKHEVTVSDNAIKLSSNEFKLLYYLASHKERVYSREQLLMHVWNNDGYVDDRAVDVQVRRLRKVLAEFNYDGYIQTVRGFGYKFSEKAAEKTEGQT